MRLSDDLRHRTKLFASAINDPELAILHRESGEIIAIFTTIVSKVRKNL